MEKENRIIFLPGSPNTKLNVPIDVDFFLTDEERAKFTNVEDFNELSVQETISGNKDCYVIRLDLYALVDLIDDHDNDRIDEIEINDDVEVTILPGDNESSDIVPDKDGAYDLRGSILALLFSAIPSNYSEVEFKNKDPEFVVYSDSEYEKEKKKNTSPFSKLDDLDL